MVGCASLISQIITDCYLMGLVAAFVGLDLVMMLTFITVQGFRNRLVATLAPSTERPRVLVGVSVKSLRTMYYYE